MRSLQNILTKLDLAKHVKFTFNMWTYISIVYIIVGGYLVIVYLDLVSIALFCFFLAGIGYLFKKRDGE